MINFKTLFGGFFYALLLRTSVIAKLAFVIAKRLREW